MTTAACGTGARTITIGDSEVPATAIAPLRQASTSLAVGPRPVTIDLRRGGYALGVRIRPNRASTANRISVSLTRAGVPVVGARVRLAAGMLTMDMGVATYSLTGSGVYSAGIPAWVMPGPWGLSFTVTPPGAGPLRVDLTDRLRS